jgi:hypothetical protein
MSTIIRGTTKKEKVVKLVEETCLNFLLFLNNDITGASFLPSNGIRYNICGGEQEKVKISSKIHVLKSKILTVTRNDIEELRDLLPGDDVENLGYLGMLFQLQKLK